MNFLILDSAQFETNENKENLSEENKETTNVSEAQQSEKPNENSEEKKENSNLTENNLHKDNIESKEVLVENKNNLEEIPKEKVLNLQIDNENVDNIKEEKNIESEINQPELENEIVKEGIKNSKEETKENIQEEKVLEAESNKEDDKLKEVPEETKENIQEEKFLEAESNKVEDIVNLVQEETKENIREEKVLEQELNKVEDIVKEDLVEAKENIQADQVLEQELNKEDEKLKEDLVEDKLDASEPNKEEEKNTIEDEKENPREIEQNENQISNDLAENLKNSEKIEIEDKNIQEVQNIENIAQNKLEHVEEQEKIGDNSSEASNDLMNKLINSETLENEVKEVQEKANHEIPILNKNLQEIKLENSLDISGKLLNINTSIDSGVAKRDTPQDNQLSEETKKLDEPFQRNQKWRTTEKKIIEEGNTLMVAEKLEYKRGEVHLKETYVDEDPDDKSAEPEKEKFVVKKLSLANFQRNSANLTPTNKVKDNKLELSKEGEDEEEIFSDGEAVDGLSEYSESVNDQEVQKVVLKLKISSDNPNLINKNESQDELLVGANAVPGANESEPLPDADDNNVAEAVDSKYNIKKILRTKL